MASLLFTFCSKESHPRSESQDYLSLTQDGPPIDVTLRAPWPKRFVFGTRSYPGNCEGEVACCKGDRGICIIIEWLTDTISLEQAISGLDTLQGIAELVPHTLDSMDFRILFDSEDFDPLQQTVLNVNRDYSIQLGDSTLVLREDQYPINYGGSNVFGRTRILYEIE